MLSVFFFGLVEDSVVECFAEAFLVPLIRLFERHDSNLESLLIVLKGFAESGYCWCSSAVLHTLRAAAPPIRQTRSRNFTASARLMTVFVVGFVFSLSRNLIRYTVVPSSCVRCSIAWYPSRTPL